MDNGHPPSAFEPTTDFPESVDTNDELVPVIAEHRAASAHDIAVQLRRRNIIRIVAVVSAVLLAAGGFGLIRSIIAVVVAYGLFMTGVKAIGAFARPIPEALPPGELRRVKLNYRCDICGTELRLTLANDQVPEPIKHCTEPMILTTDLDDVI